MELNYPRLVISAPQRSSGKTTISLGIVKSFFNKGLRVQTFKKGPDYIDPMWLSNASSKPCYNLDTYLMGEGNVISLFQKRFLGNDIAIIEGNMGLHDGLDLYGSGSTAHLSKLLKSPVILVINCKGMNRGIAPLIMGYEHFDRDVLFKGVILNQVRGSRHESKLREAIKYYCGVEVLGAIPSKSDIEMTERHMGLVPVDENPQLVNKLNNFQKMAENYIDIQRLIEIANTATHLEKISSPVDIPQTKSHIKIGIARDRVFNFYYQNNIEALIQEGAELIPFNTLYDPKLPEMNGLYIGGGFPEVFLKELERNESLRMDIHKHIEKGLPVYAECGGLMYLSRSINWQGNKASMVGSLPCDIIQSNKPKGLGYITLSLSNNNHWLKMENEMRAHEFHYSEIINLDQNIQFAYNIKRGTGIDGNVDGILYKNVFASYAHLHAISSPQWAKSFVQFLKDINYHS